MTTSKTKPDTTETDTPAVHTAWARVMADVRAVGKNDEVKTGPARFKFRGIDGVLMAVGPAMRTHGIYVVPIGVQVLTTEHNPTKSGGMMKNVTLSITWRVTGPDGDSFEGMSLGEGSDAGDKAISKAHSVAYRTFLIQSLALPTDEPDPDHTQYERAPQQAPQHQQAPQPHPGFQSWDHVLQTAASIDDLNKLGELWRSAGVGYAPAEVKEAMHDFGNSIKRLNAERAAQGIAPTDGPQQTTTEAQA